MKTNFEALNLRVHVIPSFISKREGAGSVCGLPGHLDGLMSVPGLQGHFCSIECVECCLFRPGRCRWCGFSLDPNQSAFCCEKCRTLNEISPFGSGKRFALWLSRHHPRWYAEARQARIPWTQHKLKNSTTVLGWRPSGIRVW
jgi:hypothetical protein